MNKKIKVGSEKDRLYVIPVTNLFRNTKMLKFKKRPNTELVANASILLYKHV